MRSSLLGNIVLSTTLWWLHDAASQVRRSRVSILAWMKFTFSSWACVTSVWLTEIDRLIQDIDNIDTKLASVSDRHWYGKIDTLVYIFSGRFILFFWYCSFLSSTSEKILFWRTKCTQICWFFYCFCVWRQYVIKVFCRHKHCPNYVLGFYPPKINNFSKSHKNP